MYAQSPPVIIPAAADLLFMPNPLCLRSTVRRPGTRDKLQSETVTKVDKHRHPQHARV